MYLFSIDVKWSKITYYHEQKSSQNDAVIYPQQPRKKNVPVLMFPTLSCIIQ